MAARARPGCCCGAGGASKRCTASTCASRLSSSSMCHPLTPIPQQEPAATASATAALAATTSAAAAAAAAAAASISGPAAAAAPADAPPLAAAAPSAKGTGGEPGVRCPPPLWPSSGPTDGRSATLPTRTVALDSDAASLGTAPLRSCAFTLTASSTLTLGRTLHHGAPLLLLLLLLLPLSSAGDDDDNGDAGGEAMSATPPSPSPSMAGVPSALSCASARPCAGPAMITTRALPDAVTRILWLRHTSASTASDAPCDEACAPHVPPSAPPRSTAAAAACAAAAATRSWPSSQRPGTRRGPPPSPPPPLSMPVPLTCPPPALRPPPASANAPSSAAAVPIPLAKTSTDKRSARAYSSTPASSTLNGLPAPPLGPAETPEQCVAALAKETVSIAAVSRPSSAGDASARASVRFGPAAACWLLSATSNSELPCDGASNAGSLRDATILATSSSGRGADGAARRSQLSIARGSNRLSQPATPRPAFCHHAPWVGAAWSARGVCCCTPSATCAANVPGGAPLALGGGARLTEPAASAGQSSPSKDMSSRSPMRLLLRTGTTRRQGRTSRL
eukprot:358857-Chlamydomonas_euryale.AAC.3